MAAPDLATYLRERRERLDAATLGHAGARRRTPGLRREEVAARAGISATWYTWLEQGRGGAPSAEALERISRALLLNEVEREHLFLLGLGRPPAVRYQPECGVTPRLQRVLDGMETSPALLSTVGWDVVAWNAAAAAVLTDYTSLPPEARNILRLVFLDPRSRQANLEWEGVARFVVAVFRSVTARAGAGTAVRPLVEELRRASPDFARIWDEGEVRGFDAATKRLSHPVLGDIALECSAFAVDGRPELTMLVFNPARRADAERIRALVASA